MNKSGTVLKTENGRALVMIIRDSACGDNCAGCGICSREKTVWIKNDADVKKGDKVELFVKSRNFLLMCALAYVLPLFLSIMFICFFYSAPISRQVADLCSVIAVVITIFVMTIIKPGKKFRISILKKEGQDNGED